MSPRATVVLNLLITLAILAFISGAFHIARLMDDCETTNPGQRCTLSAKPEGGDSKW